jgi:hypothetical protein
MTPWSPAKAVRRSPTLGQAPQPSVYSGDKDTLVPAFAFVGIKPEDVKAGVLIGLGGAAVTAVSTLLPDTIKPLGVLSGVMVAGYGVYRVYGTFFGDPVEERCDIPQQSTKALSLVQGEFLAPVNNGGAELSTMWSVFWKANRTYKLKFRILNNSEQELVIPVQVQVTEHTTLGPDKTSTGNFCVTVPPRGQKIIDGFMPVFGEMALGIACVGQLILKYPTQTGQSERILQVIQFSI